MYEYKKNRKNDVRSRP